MKKKAICLVISIIIILVGTISVQASTVTAKFTPSSTEVKQGETFTITLNVECIDGINGVTGIKCNYDKNNLELVGYQIDSTNFTELTDSDLICKSTNKITSSNIYKWNFKVKDTAIVGEKINISLDRIILDSDAAQNSTVTIETQNTTITVLSKNASQETGGDTTGGDTTGGDTTGGDTTGGDTTGGDTTGGNTTGGDTTGGDTTGGNTTGGNTVIGTNIVVGENTNSTEASTTSDKDLPKTGLVAGISIAIIVVTAISIVSYLKYNKYKTLK